MDGLPDLAPLAPAPQQKRDEWSEGGISRLLEAYEAKWLLRNRAKLKWSDWVDIANDVSAHCCSSEAGKPGGTAKTPNQCKNKVESMKKRYRAESAAAARARASPGPGPGGAAGAGTSWRFFGRMDGLLKGPVAATGCSGQVQTEPSNSIIADLRAAPVAKAEIDVELQADIAASLRQPPPDARPAAGALSDLLNADANGSASEKAEKVDQVTQKEAADSDAANASSPRSKEEANGGDAEEAWDDVLPSRKRKGSGSGSELDVARSIELLASSFVKIERARMEMYRETERIRAEAEVRKGEMELKRTEIMAKTQLQIARLFAKRLKEFSGGNGKNGGSSSDVDTLAKKGENGSG